MPFRLLNNQVSSTKSQHFVAARQSPLGHFSPSTLELSHRETLDMGTEYKASFTPLDIWSHRVLPRNPRARTERRNVRPQRGGSTSASLFLLPLFPCPFRAQDANLFARCISSSRARRVRCSPARFGRDNDEGRRRRFPPRVTDRCR